jgi:hypothetical protein
MAGGLNSADVPREMGGDVGGTVAGDEGDFANFAGWIDGIEEGDQLGWGHGGADFDADGVGDAAEKFDVCAR